MIDRKKKEESLKQLVKGHFDKQFSEIGESEINELFKSMVNPLRNVVGYSGISNGFKVFPICSECHMEFESEESRSSHTAGDCTAYKVHNS